VRRIKSKLSVFLLVLSTALYIALLLTQLSSAEPTGAGVTNLSTETYSVSPESRQDAGGTITTLTLDATQQLNAWKAYVGNITGTLVLRNSDGWSIYEWSMNSSTLSGNIFVSRNDSLNWSSGAIRCANSSIIDSEQSFLGMNSSASYSINRTFNYTTHKTMSISGVGAIQNSTCPSTATWVNGSAQTVTETSYFQEILLTDLNNLIYATFIDQDAWGYNNNASVNGTTVTYDFQLIVAENRSSSVGTVYYFYADIA